jgi:hypothetical protein
MVQHEFESGWCCDGLSTYLDVNTSLIQIPMQNLLFIFL